MPEPTAFGRIEAGEFRNTGAEAQEIVAQASGLSLFSKPADRLGMGKVPVLRSALAGERAMHARAALANCRLCAHECRANRLISNSGLCHAGAKARVFSAQIEVTDELELIPTFAIAFSGCDMRCDFCITGNESWNARTGEPLNIKTLAHAATDALADGARTIMFLGGEPTIHLPTVLTLVAALPDDAKLVWKTNAHGSAQARELLDGIFDVWLADYKFGNDDCAQRLAKVPNYSRVVRENLLWFAGTERQWTAGTGARLCAGVGAPAPADWLNHKAAAGRGRHSRAPRGELIVRHLLMPGHVECCWRPIAEWLAENLPDVKLNLRFGFWPAWRSSRHSELSGTIPEIETVRAWEISRECELNLVE